MLVRQSFDVAGRQVREDFLEAAVTVGVAVAVQFEDSEEQQQLLEMIRSQPVVHGVQRVGDGTRDGSLLQVADKFKDVCPQPLDVGVLGFGDVVDEDVNLAPVFGEIGSDLLTDKGPRQMRDLEGALDFVVVRDGDECHAPPPRDVVEMKRLGKTLGTADFLEEPLGRPRGMSRMYVQVRLHHCFHTCGMSYGDG